MVNMNRAGKCPHCGIVIRTHGVLRVSRHTPYRCDACGGEAIISPTDGMRIVLGWVVAIAIPGAMLDYFQAGEIALFVLCAIGACMLPLVFARFCQFEVKR
jgi:hypothetical protein